MSGRSLRRQKDAEHVDVEQLVEVILGDAFEWRKFVDARVVHEDVDAAKMLNGRFNDALRQF